MSVGSVIIAILLLRFQKQTNMFHKLEKLANKKVNAEILYKSIEDQVKQMEINN